MDRPRALNDGAKECFASLELGQLREGGNAKGKPKWSFLGAPETMTLLSHPFSFARSPDEDVQGKARQRYHGISNP